MQRYLYRVQYTYTDDGTSSYEAVCIRAETEAAALAEVTAATARYPTAIGATRTITLTLVTADV
jgi:hypothetical protein